MSTRAAPRRADKFSSNSSRIGSESRDTHDPALALRREGQAGADICFLQLREIGQNFVFAHPRSKIRENIPDRDAGPAHARLAEADLRVDDDALSVIHDGGTIGRFIRVHKAGAARSPTWVCPSYGDRMLCQKILAHGDAETGAVGNRDHAVL